MTNTEKTDPVDQPPKHDPDATGATAVSSAHTVGSEAFSRILHALLLCLFAWLALWVFGVVTLVQWGFLLLTGQVNDNLKGFHVEVGRYITQVMRYLTFESDDKPFPFSSWPHHPPVMGGDSSKSAPADNS